MTTSLAPSLREIADGEKIPIATRLFFRERFRIKLHQLLLRQFVLWERETRLTRRALAQRISKRPEVVTRCLGAPSNLTLDTVSDLLLGMGLEPTLDARSLMQPQAADGNQTSTTDARDVSEVVRVLQTTPVRADTMRPSASARIVRPVYELQAASGW
jgi:hypothetical protein